MDLADSEFAHAYVDEFLSLSIATQLKVLREQRKLTQEELAHLAGMKQERISVLENVNYSSWSINTLRKLAKSLDVVLKVSFETFSSRVTEMKNVTRESLERPSREEELELDAKLESPNLLPSYYEPTTAYTQTVGKTATAGQTIVGIASRPVLPGVMSPNASSNQPPYSIVA
jgi:transcriptional regulator with XRE-family HTH domain